jgi:hypothetical protein
MAVKITLLSAIGASAIALAAHAAPIPRLYPADPPVANLLDMATESYWECGLIRINPRDNDSDPGFKINVVIGPGHFETVHTSISGKVYVRGEQYRDVRVWNDRNGESKWTGVWMRSPKVTMVGSLGKNPVTKRMEYVERVYRSGNLETTISSTCFPVDPE